MRPRRLLGLALLGLALAFPGAAEETPAAGVTLTVQVHRNPGGREVAFDYDLDQVGLLALRVTAQNDSQQELIVRRSDMTLRLTGGRQVGSISAKQAALRADAGADVAGVTAGAIFLGYTGAVLAGSVEEAARQKQIGAYDGKEFKDIALATSEGAEGYVFFHLPSGVASVQGAELLVRLVDVESGAIAVVPVPLVDVGGPPVEVPERESRLVREAGRDVATQPNEVEAAPQADVVGAVSRVTVAPPDPTATESLATGPAEVKPMTGTMLTAPPPRTASEIAAEEAKEAEPDTGSFTGPANRP